MLRVLQKIRQRLIEEGNLKRYLMYALGEIVLVVVGILIALQINNWNEYRKMQQKEIVLLQDLHKDLASNAATLREELNKNQKVINNLELLINHFENDLTFTDSFAILLPTIQYTYQLVLVTSGFESLKSTGFDILQSNELKLQIINLYDKEYTGVTQWINTGSINKADVFQSVFSDLPRGDISSHYQEILSHDKLFNLIKANQNWKEEVINRLTLLLQETLEVMGVVEKALLE